MLFLFETWQWFQFIVFHGGCIFSWSERGLASLNPCNLLSCIIVRKVLKGRCGQCDAGHPWVTVLFISPISSFLLSAHSGCFGGSRDPHLSLQSLCRAAAHLLTIINCYTACSFSCPESYFGSYSKHIRTYRYIQKNESFHYELGTQIFWKILYGSQCNCQSNIALTLASCCQNFFPLTLDNLFPKYIASISFIYLPIGLHLWLCKS